MSWPRNLAVVVLIGLVAPTMRGAGDDRRSAVPGAAGPVLGSAGATMATVLSRADVAAMRSAIGPNELKGMFGEAHMDRFLSLALGEDVGWSRLSARLGPQGIDGLWIQRDAHGNPIGLRVVEAKYGTSRLKMTADGIQLGETWTRSRLRGLAAEYREIAEAARSGRLPIAKTGSVGRFRLQFPMSDRKAAVFARDPRGGWEFVGTPNRLAEAGRDAGRIGDYLDRAGRGLVEAKRYIYRHNISNGISRTTVKDASLLDEVGRESRLPTVHDISKPLTGLEFARVQRVARPEVARILRRRYPTMADAEANRFARELIRSPKDFKRLSTLATIGRTSLSADAALGLRDVALTAGSQYASGGGIDWGDVGKSGLATFVGASAGKMAGQGTIVMMKRNPIASQFAQRTSVALGLGSTSLNRGVGGGVEGIATAYVGYFLGLDNLETAHRSALTDVLTRFAGAATSAGMLAIAATFGTASTGTAIGTLHGAAFASASAAWWGGGSIAAGGLGVWGGTIVMTGGAAIVAIGTGYLVYQAFNYFDAAEEAKRIRLTIQALEARKTFPIAGSGQVRFQSQSIGAR